MKPSVTATGLSILALAVVFASGCANRESNPVYLESEEVDPIEVPEDLDRPSVRSTYEVPGYFLPELAGAGNEARPPRVLPSAEAEASRSRIAFGPTGLHLEVEDEPESVWRRLGFTLDRDRMSVREVDESERRYRFEFNDEAEEIRRRGLARLAVWRGTEIRDYSGTYRAEIEEAGDRTRVALFHADGDLVELDRAEHILAILRERLG